MRFTRLAVVVLLLVGGATSVLSALRPDAVLEEPQAERSAGPRAPSMAAPPLLAVPPTIPPHEAADAAPDVQGETSRGTLAASDPAPSGGDAAVCSGGAGGGGVTPDLLPISIGPASDEDVPPCVEDPLRPRAYDVGRLLARAPDARQASNAYDWTYGTRPLRLERLTTALLSADRRDGRPEWQLDVTDGRRLVLTPRRAEEVAEFEALLDREARVGGDALSVHVTVYPDVAEVAAAFGIAPPGADQVVETPDGAPGTRLPEPVGSLELDVPSDHRVRAFRGASFGYVQDYDIEVGEGGFGVGDAMVGALDVGLSASGLLETTPEATSCVGLEVAWSVGPPSFGMFSGSRSSWEIEIPKVAAAAFQGRVPARPGTRWILGLTRGAGAVVVVGGVVPGPASVPAWRPVGVTQFLGTGLGRMDLTDAELLDVTLEAPRSSAGVFRGVLLTAEEGVNRDRLNFPGPALEAGDLSIESEKVPVLSEDVRHAVAGGVRLDVCAQPDEGGARAFDVVLDVGAVMAGAERVVSAWSDTDPYRLRLPCARHAAVSFRIHLAHGETVVREIGVDVAGRPERWSLSIARR